jgi:colanic acid/amylovoran biosynthesis glycosyltransferase
VEKRAVLSWTERASHKLRQLLVSAGQEGEITAAYVSAFRRYRVQAVLAEYGTTGVVLMDACHSLGLPLIVHFHGYDASVREVLARNVKSYSKMFRQAGAIIAVSRAMQQKLIALGAPHEKVHYNPCGIDTAKFSGADPGSAPPILIAVGRFVEKKAPQVTLTAFSEVHRRRPEARLHMIGDGPLLDKCRELAKILAIAHVVNFLGEQPQTVVQEAMRGARCFVQHSVEAPNGDCEGTPVAILEAGATGLPVVATRHGGIPDVVIEGETGVLVDERDLEGMTEGMLRLIDDPELARRLGQGARHRVETHFSKQTSDDHLFGIIRSCIAALPIR